LKVYLIFWYKCYYILDIKNFVTFSTKAFVVR